MTKRPPDTSLLLSRFTRFIFTLAGWHTEGELPNEPKFIVVGAPHTSNWDGLLLVFYATIHRARMQWLGKHTLFRFPFGWLMRLAGGVPINRSTTKNAVEQAVQVFNEREKLILTIAPEGTRHKSDNWKTGFYYIALGAKIPLVMGYVDYAAKAVGIGPTLFPTGDIEADFVKFREFYTTKTGKYPEAVGPIIPAPPKHKTPASAD